MNRTSVLDISERSRTLGNFKKTVSKDLLFQNTSSGTPPVSLESPIACEIVLPQNDPEKASLEPKLSLRMGKFQELALRSLNFRVIRVELSREY